MEGLIFGILRYKHSLKSGTVGNLIRVKLKMNKPKGVNQTIQ